MGCCGSKRVTFNQTRKVAISPSGNTLSVGNSSIPNNITPTCIHVYQLQNTVNLGGKNYKMMRCSKCGNTKTVYLT